MIEPNDDLPSWEDLYDIGLFRAELERVGILDTTCYGKLKEETNSVLDDLSRLGKQPPDCVRDRENYKALFDTYKERLGELNGRRKRLLEKLKKVAETEKYIEEGKLNIDLINAFLANNQRLSYYEKTRDRERAKETKSYISMRVGLFQTFTKDQIAESRQLCEKLESCDDILDELRADTHEWVPIEYQTLPLRPSQIATETSSLERRAGEERRVVAVVRCKRCGAEKKVGSDGIS